MYLLAKFTQFSLKHTKGLYKRVHENKRERSAKNPKEQIPVRDPCSTDSTAIKVEKKKKKKRMREDSPGTTRSGGDKIYVRERSHESLLFFFFFLLGCFPYITYKTNKLLILAETCFLCGNAQEALVRNIFPSW